MEWVIKRAGRGESGDGGRGDPFAPPGGDNCVRLRGLPFDCTKMDIANFFDGKKIRTSPKIIRIFLIFLEAYNVHRVYLWRDGVIRKYWEPGGGKSTLIAFLMGGRAEGGGPDFEVREAGGPMHMYA
jgi:hypothetical protein